MIEREEAIELHHGSGRAQLEEPARDLGVDIDGRALELGGLHLARDRAQPDQLVELGLIRIEETLGLPRAAGEVGRADRFVRLLGVLRLGLVAPRRLRHIARPIVAFDHAAHGADRLINDLHAVGAHIGDEADGLAAEVDTLVKALRDAHGMGGSKAELAACFLLQRGGGEGRLRVALDRLRLDAGHGEGGGFECLFERFGFGSRADVEALQLFSVGADEARFERIPPWRRQCRDQRPIFLADEFLDLELAVAHEPQRDRLHPAG